MSFALSRLQRNACVLESTYGTVPGTFPTATSYYRFIRCQLNNNPALIQRPDKTGDRSGTAGTAGRKFCQFAIEMGLSASGTAGTAPHVDPYLEAIMGQASTGASISYVDVNGSPQSHAGLQYTLSDSIPSLTIGDFRGVTASGAFSDRIAHGCVLSEATFNLGQDAATWSVQGDGQWALERDQFGAATTTEKGGLGAFPSEPGSPDATDGGLTIGFTGQMKVDGNVMASIRTATVRVATANETVKDTFGTFYPTDVIGGERFVTIAMSLYDEDISSTQGTYVNNIRALANSKTPFDITMQVGTVLGNIWIFDLKNVQLGPLNVNESGLRFAIDIGDSRATETAIGDKDELVISLV